MQDTLDPAPRRVSAAGLTAPARRAPAPSQPTTQPGTPAPRKSAAGLIVPERRPPTRPSTIACEAPRSDAERRALFDRLRALRDEIRPACNKPDLAVALIEACIAGGICTKPAIMSALVHLHLDNRFAGVMFDTGAKAGRWVKGADGRYRLPAG